MEKYLITGFSGFVSGHFLNYLEENRIESSILGLDMNPAHLPENRFRHVTWDFMQIDLLKKDLIENVIFQFQPDYILHLASYSSVGFSWKEPEPSFVNNTNIFLILLEAVRKLGLECRILSIGSSEEYGDYPPEELPLLEEYALRPVNPYAVARVAQELLSRVYVTGYGLDIVMTRSFNHIGPHQKEVFAVPSFAKQLAEIKKTGNRTGTIVAGDVGIVRDFVDVRDVVAAYHLLFRNGRNGEVYNVCSGSGISLKDIVEKMVAIMDLEVEIKVNSRFIRPNDNRMIVGANDKLRKATGWTMKYTIEQSLRDILTWFLETKRY